MKDMKGRLRRLRELVLDGLQIAFRFVPWPTEPGLRAVGTPGRASPVIITCNYDYTVRRVVRALAGIDVWVVVAPSSGINVWCAASGGHFTTHQVITALKTSGIDERVSQHRAILPQLAATGVSAREVSRRCGWKVRFGPVYAKDVPRFLAQGGKKSDDMRRVRFSLTERLEMAAAWAVPTSVIIGGAAALLHPAWSIPVMLLASVLSLAVFGFYDRIPGPRRLVLGASATLASLVIVALGGGSPPALAAATVAPVVLTAILTYDYSGSTPIEGGSHFQEAEWHVKLDLERCRGVYFCWDVCPEACYEKREETKEIEFAHADRCIRCGACVVQCPTDALAFEDQNGRRIEPDVVRRFKLNLLGKRAVDVGERTEA